MSSFTKTSIVLIVFIGLAVFANGQSISGSKKNNNCRKDVGTEINPEPIKSYAHQISGVLLSETVDLSMPGIYEIGACVHLQGDEVPSNDCLSKIVENTESPLEPPQNLTAVVIGGDNLHLCWDPPVGYNNWLFWDDQVNYGGISAGGFFYCASRWEPDDLVSYNGMYLEKISYFNCGNSALYEIMVWQGENAATLLVNQNVGFSWVGEWSEIELNTPVLIDATEELWFGYSVLNQAGELSAGTDDGPAIQYKGDLISLDGESWVSMSAEYGLDYNWNLAGFVANSSDGNEIAIPLENKNISNRLYQNSPDFKLVRFTDSLNSQTIKENKDLLSYNIYEDSILVGNTTDDEFYIYNLLLGNYEYYVTAVYDEGESGPSNIAVVSHWPAPGNFTATVFNLYNVHLHPGSPVGGSPTSYNFYRNDTLIGNNTSPHFYEYNLAIDTYEYYATCVYGGVESMPSNSVIVEINTFFCFDFDDLTVGQGVALQIGGPHWPIYPYSEDAIVTDEQSNSPENSFIVNEDVDMIFILDSGPIYEGTWSYSHYLYVPSGFSGYFNVQTDPTPGVGWNIELYFDDGGTGYFGSQSTETYTYTQDTWFQVTINYDLNSGWAQVLFDDEQILLFENSMTIGGIDYYGWNGGGPPGAYYDDVCFGEGIPLLTPPTNLTVEYQDTDILLNWEPPYYNEDLLGYKIYHSFESGDYYELDYTTDTTYTHIEPLSGLHCYMVSAVYDIGESIPCEEVCELIDRVGEYSVPVVQIYPNPAKEFIHISTKTEIRSIKVYDVTGLLLCNKLVNNSTFNFSTSEFETGLYMFQVETNEGLFSEKVIIE